MHLDKIHAFQTGVSVEISTAAVHALIEDAAEGTRLAELARMQRLEDLYPYLTVTVRRGAPALMQRRSRWADGVRHEILAGKPVSYERFSKLFWRDIDEEDPDGDEWHRDIAGVAFASELVALLDKVRSAQRALRRSDDVLIRMDWEILGAVTIPKEQRAV